MREIMKILYYEDAIIINKETNEEKSVKNIYQIFTTKGVHIIDIDNQINIIGYIIKGKYNVYFSDTELDDYNEIPDIKEIDKAIIDKITCYYDGICVHLNHEELYDANYMVIKFSDDSENTLDLPANCDTTYCNYLIYRADKKTEIDVEFDSKKGNK